MSVFNIATPTLIVWMATLAALVSVAAIAAPFVFPAKSKSARFKQVTAKRRELSRQQLDGLTTKGSLLRQRQKSTKAAIMKKVLVALKLDQALSSKELKLHLSQAGYRFQNALVFFQFARFAAAVAGPFVALFLIESLGSTAALPYALKLVGLGLGALAGFYLPKLLVINQAQKRQQEINLGFADALDLIVICVEGGLSVENAFERVTEEIAEASPTLAQEFALTSAELAYLGDRHKAYQNFADRTGLPAIKSLATTLIQSEKYGTPVGQALKVLSQERRQDRMAIAERKGAALPAKLTVPMIIFFLPPLFAVVIGPAAIQISHM